MKKLLLLLVAILLLTGCDKSIYSRYEAVKENEALYEKFQDLTYAEYKEKINNKETFVMLLYQTGCSHCETFEPTLNEVVKYYNLEIYGLNLSTLSEKEYAIVKNKTFVEGTPTTVYIEEGKYINKIVGAKDAQGVINFLVNSNYLKEK